MNVFMSEALKEAGIAATRGEVPVGAVIVKDGVIIASAHNLKETLCDPTAHAEILAIRRAADVLNDWRLDNCDIYVTLEPCPMCAGAISEARIRRVYFGAYDTLLGAAGSFQNLIRNSEIYGGICEDECSSLLSSFFKSRRYTVSHSH